MESSSSDEHVILVCKNSDQIEKENGKEEIFVSTTDILNWDFSTILSFHTIKIQAPRNRLIEQSSYFRGLLCGSFSESCSGSTIVEWNVVAFMYILKYLYGCPLDITSDNFLSLYEGALYFGVDTLLLKCKTWFSDVASSKGFQSTQMQLEDLILIWKFGLEHASDFISELCTGYLARNFTWAMHNSLFVKIPYNMLLSSIEHPDLTIDSEIHLADASFRWLESDMKNLESMSKVGGNCNRIIKQIRVGLLPLWFAAGKRNSLHFRQFAEESLDSIFKLIDIPPMGSQDILGYDDWKHLRIRLTEYSKKVNLSDCPQITLAILLLSVIPLSYPIDLRLRKMIKQLFNNFELPFRDKSEFQPRLLQTLSFEAVLEVDISKCRKLHIEGAIECFCKSFPSLRILRAAYLLNIRTANFLQLMLKCPQICEIDLTVDVTPLIPALVSVVSSSPVMTSLISEGDSSVKYRAVDVLSFYGSEPPLSNITNLTLEGRTDVYDLDLQYISKFCVSLHHLNLKGCVSVTDTGMSYLIHRCTKLNSVLVCDTSFGVNSVEALSSAISGSGSFASLHSRDRHLSSLASNLQTLHMGGCQGVSGLSLLKLMSQMQVLKGLCLRGTNLDDQALHNFPGSSLEMLDVSNTKISGAALAHVINRNPSLKCLKARDCRNFLHEELYAKLGRMCRLEEADFGWGFSSLSLKALEPAMMSLRTINVGLGGMLDEDALRKLPANCPMLETIILHFQVISDATVMNIATSLRNLQVLALCYCFGDISISSFKLSMQNLRKLRLERVTPWMTNDDLAILTQNCKNLVELSLLGCSLLNSDSQQIISHGWPGLISIHLEGLLGGCSSKSSSPCLHLLGILEQFEESNYERNFAWDGMEWVPLGREKKLVKLWDFGTRAVHVFDLKYFSCGLMECGEVTANGLSSLLDCKGLENLLLRHNGPGLARNFIFYVASKMPLLRKLSLDLCDASEGDFDIPDYADRYFLSSLKISRCKSQRCAFHLPSPSQGSLARSVHVETLVLVWNSRDLIRAVVKERL